MKPSKRAERWALQDDVPVVVGGFILVLLCPIVWLLEIIWGHK